MIDRHSRLIAGYAVVAAAVATVVSPLLALAYLSTGEGRSGLRSATTAWWAEPLLQHASWLVDWSSPDRSYATYTQVIAVLFPAVLACAILSRTSRHPQGRAEWWGWLIALIGYGIGTVGLLVAALTLIPGRAGSSALNLVFMVLMVPGMLCSLIGSTVLGIALLRRDFRPLGTGWLLALAIPLFVCGNLLGHNSLGMLPIMIAWGLAGLRIISTESAPEPQPSRSRPY